MNIAMTQPGVAVAPPLKDKVSLVTGSTSGIGLGIARALAAAGSPVTFTASASPRRSSPRSDHHLGVDIRQPRCPRQQCGHSARRAVAGVSGRQVARHHGHQFELGVPYDTSCPAEHDRQEMGAHHQYRLGAWLVGSPFKSAYVTGKHGMLGLTKVTALDTAELGITCNPICPGYVYTPLVEAQIDGQAKGHGIPTRRAAGAAAQ